MLCVGAGILVAGGWVGLRTVQAYRHLEEVSDQVDVLQTEIRDVTAIDPRTTDFTVSRLQAESAAAESAVSDPLFRAAGTLPLIGPNLQAIFDVTSTVQSVSTDVLPSLVTVVKTVRLSALAPKNGVIDLVPIEAASPLLKKADAVVDSARDRLAAVDRSVLVRPLANAVLTLSNKLDQVSAVTGPGARATRLLLPMLGADGPRTYLVVFQNPAEARATGGIFGSFAAARVDHGKITIVDQGAGSRTLHSFDPPITQLPSQISSLYGDLMGIYPQDVNLSPDFPLAAQLFAKMYTARKGTVIDGVIATDPVALSYALKGTGSISVGSGVTLTSTSIVPILLSTAYSTYAHDPGQVARDNFLAHATGIAFTKVMSGTGNDKTTLAGLKQGADERRILLWSSHPVEQKDIAQTGLAGTLSTTPANPSIGVFLNDTTTAKLGYYLNNSIEVTPGDCQSDGRRQLHLAITLRSTAPAKGLPSYVLGTSPTGQSYEMRTNLMIFAPVGGGVVSANLDNKAAGVQRGEQSSREVLQLSVTLKPAAAKTVDVTILGPAPAVTPEKEVRPLLVLTPGVHPWRTSVTAYPVCRQGR